MTATMSTDPAFLTVDQGGQLCGVSGDTMRRWIASGALDGIAIQINRRWRLRTAALRRWIDGGMPTTKSEAVA